MQRTFPASDDWDIIPRKVHQTGREDLEDTTTDTSLMEALYLAKLPVSYGKWIGEQASIELT